MTNYRTLNTITISADNLLSNYSYFKKLTNTKIAPVLKSNAYGHGLIKIAKFVDKKLNAPFICVDSLYEAYELFKARIKTPILILGYTHPSNYKIWKKLPFIFTVSDKETLIALNKHQPGARIHIMIDTGMNRLGVKSNNLPEFEKILKKCNNIKVEGILTHLSSAHIPQENTFTNTQIQKFEDAVLFFEKRGYNFTWKHIASTAGASVKEFRSNKYNVTRLGIGFYGYSPFAPHTKISRIHRQSIKPALELTSTVAHIKNIEKGESVGYSRKHIAKQSESIAILPLGYNEGIPLNLSSNGTTIINNKLCNIAGQISMNMCAVKVNRETNAKVGDKVIIISRDPDSPNSIYSLSNAINTIPYVLLTNLHTSIKREVV